MMLQGGKLPSVTVSKSFYLLFVTDNDLGDRQPDFRMQDEELETM